MPAQQRATLSQRRVQAKPGKWRGGPGSSKVHAQSGDRARAGPTARELMRLVDYASTLVVMIIWGLQFPVAKIGVTELPPLFFMAIRFVLVAALICPFFSLPRDKLRSVLLLAFVLGSLHFTCMFVGLSLMDASTASLLVQSQV